MSSVHSHRQTPPTYAARSLFLDRGNIASKQDAPKFSLPDFAGDDGPDPLAAVFRHADEEISMDPDVVDGRFEVLQLESGNDRGEGEVEFCVSKASCCGFGLVWDFLEKKKQDASGQ